MRKRVVLSGVAVIAIIAATNTAQATFASSTEPLNLENSYKGKTAQQWHALYVAEYLDKNEAYQMIGTLMKSPNSKPAANKKKSLKHVTFLREKIAEHRAEAWRWQDIMLVRRTPSANLELSTTSRAYLKWLAKKWYDRRVTAKTKAENPPHKAQWECIHRYEGSWTDPNAPYYGGLQMDYSFQRAHGPDALARWGTADHWHPLTQMWVAERAYKSGLGFHPWPNTARFCGLL